MSTRNSLQTRGRGGQRRSSGEGCAVVPRMAEARTRVGRAGREPRAGSAALVRGAQRRERGVLHQICARSAVVNTVFARAREAVTPCGRSPGSAYSRRKSPSSAKQVVGAVRAGAGTAETGREVKRNGCHLSVRGAKIPKRVRVNWRAGESAVREFTPPPPPRGSGASEPGRAGPCLGAHLRSRSRRRGRSTASRRWRTLRCRRAKG